jgi:hypothetical protein
MNDDVEQRLDRLTPRGVRPELREQVLGAVENELTKGTEEVVGETWRIMDNVLRQPPPSPWLRRASMAVAASLLLGVGLNLWATQASENRLAQLFGPPPISMRAMEIANDVERIADAKTGQWVYRQLTVPRQPGDAVAAYTKYRDAMNRLINELRTVSKDTYHETPQKDPEMDRGHTGCPVGNRFDCQRLVRLDHRYTA